MHLGGAILSIRLIFSLRLRSDQSRSDKGFIGLNHRVLLCHHESGDTHVGFIPWNCEKIFSQIQMVQLEPFPTFKSR